MEYSVQKKPHSQVEVTITTTAEETSLYLEEAAKRLGKKMKVAGFREGNVPPDVVRAKAGDAAIYTEALEHALPLLFTEVVKKENMHPVSKPNAEIVSDNPIAAKLTVDLMPEVTVGDIAKISVTCKPKKISADDENKTLKQLKDSFADFAEVSRASKNTDRVEIDFEGFDADKKPIAGAKSSHHPVILGNSVFVPGFEEELVGLQKDAVKEFDVTFPADYHAEDLKSRKVHFSVKVHKVEERREPALSDEFVQKVTGHKLKTVEELKKEITGSLEQQALIDARRECEEKVIDAIVAASKADLPQSMVDEEIGFLLSDFNERLNEQGMSEEQFLKAQGLTAENFRESFRKAAIRRITLRLALNVIASREKIEPTEKEVQDAMKKANIAEKDQKRAHSYVKVQIRLQKALEFLFAKTIRNPEKK